VLTRRRKADINAASCRAAGWVHAVMDSEPGHHSDSVSLAAAAAAADVDVDVTD